MRLIPTVNRAASLCTKLRFYPDPDSRWSCVLKSACLRMISMRTASSFVTAASLVVSLVIVGCSRKLNPPLEIPIHGSDKQVLNVASSVRLRSLDPAIAFDEASDPILRLVFARLFHVSPSGQIEGDLVRHYHLSQDGLRLTLHLREDAMFHDGRPVEASDVVRSLHRALHPKTPSPTASFFQSIEGFAEFRSGATPTLSGVETVSATTLRITLREPDASFLALLSLPVTSPVCRNAGTSYDPTWASRACGAGPFRLLRRDGEQSMELVRSDAYFDRASIRLEAIRWLFGVPATSQGFRFQLGQLDLVRELSTADTIAFRSDPWWSALGHWSEPRSTRGLFMNTEMKPFDDPRVRKAASLAIDRRQIATLRAGHLVAAAGIVPAGVVGHDRDMTPLDVDLDQARLLMREAGYAYDPKTTSGGYPNTVDYYCAAESFDVTVAELLQQQLMRIGVRIRINAVAWPTYLALTSRRHRTPMGSDGWTADFDDPSDFFDPLFSSASIHPEDSQNRSFYSNVELDRVLKQARQTFDPRKRRELYREADKLIRRDAPWVALYGSRHYEIRQGYVRGYHPHPYAPWHIANLWIDTNRKELGRRTHRAPPVSVSSLALRLARIGGRR